MHRSKLLPMTAILLYFSLAAALFVMAAQKAHDCQFCGLYYLDDEKNPESTALVISSDAQPIAPKLNDPDAPTRPGLHVETDYFPFVSSKLSRHTFSFHTAKIGGVEFLFDGQFGYQRSTDLVPPKVPFLTGKLVEKKNGVVTRTIEVRFVHAVIY